MGAALKTKRKKKKKKFREHYIWILKKKREEILLSLTNTYVQDLEGETCKPLIKDVKQEPNKLRYSVSMDKKTKYYQDVNSTKFIL